MNKTKKDPVREERIHNDAIADANGPEEQVMGWYYYLESRLNVPFRARCVEERAVSPLAVGERVEVVGMPPGRECEQATRGFASWRGSSTAP